MRRITVFALAVTMMAVAAVAHAKVVGREVEYQQGEAALVGFLAKDDAVKGKRPGVIVVHEWWGHNHHARNAATKLAEAGYVAFALDMFGKGKVTTHPEEAEKFVQEAMANLAEMSARFDAARLQLMADPDVNPEKLAAIGYCFGGSVALGQARAGADLDAVASFHGALGTEHPAEKGKVKAHILVLTGADDAWVPAEQVEAFRKEMTAAGAKFSIVSYPGAKHGFSNPDAGSFGIDNLAYNADADKKSWAEMLKVFKKALK